MLTSKHGGNDQTKGNLQNVALEGKVDEAMEDAAGAAAALVEDVEVIVRVVVGEAGHFGGVLSFFFHFLFSFH